MKNIFSIVAIAFSLVLITDLSLASDLTKAPKGWDDKQNGGVRIVSNGNATVTISPWIFLAGVSAEQLLSRAALVNPNGGKIISSKEIKPESAVPGAFTVTRKVQFADKKGHSILYVCPGQQGHARMLTLDVINGGLLDTYKGGTFLEKVCTTEPPGAGLKGDSQTNSKSTDSSNKDDMKTKQSDQQLRFPDISDDELRTANQSITDQYRPLSANMHSDTKMRGYPAMLTLEVYMGLNFKSDIQLACTDWDPTAEVDIKALAKTEDCELYGKLSSTKLYFFKPGERIEIKFGRINAVGYDLGDSHSGGISGGSLLMNKDGEIVIGNWQANYVSTSNAGASSSNTGAIIGRYYLDGHTITIATNDGGTHHGFIGINKDDNEKIASIFINGNYFWELSD